MSSYAFPRSLAGRRTAGALAAVFGGLLVAAALGITLARLPVRLELAAVGGVALVLLLTLAVVRLDAAAALGFALLGVVLVEPAPADITFFVVVAVTLVTGRFWVRRVPGVPVAMVGVFLALNLLSAVEVVDATRAATFFATTLYLAVFAVWVAAWVRTRRRARIVAGGYVLGAVASAALGLLAFFAPIPGRELMVIDDRVQALFKDPNVFGPFLVPAVLIMVEDTLTPRLFRLRRALKVALVVLLALGVLLSFSRGAWANLAAGLAVVLVVLALRRGGGRKVIVMISLVLVAAAAAAGTVAVTGSSGFVAERAQLQSYDADRLGAQLVGVDVGERYPFGVGPGQFELVASISTHSIYVRVFAEQGLVGLLVLVALALFTLIAAVGNAVAGRGTYGIGSAALLGAWCGILVNSFVIDTLHWRHLWLVAALIWAGWARRTEADARG